MRDATKLAEWVEKKPLVLIRFDEEYSDSLFNTKQGFEQLTVAKPHSVYHNFKLPTLCLLEIHEHDETQCFLGTVTGKTAVSTFDSRLTIKKLRSIVPSSLDKIKKRVTDKRFQRLLNDKILAKTVFSVLSSKLSAHVIHLLASFPENQPAMDVALSQLPKLRRISNTNWAQEDAIHSAMAAFGIRANEIPSEVVLKRGASSGLSQVGSHLYEDNVVRADASQLPGFDAIAPDITGRAIFEKRDERLIIYTANKLPLEKMLGVDLIYINETRGNIVMIQYKMLEEAKGEIGSIDWLFRPDNQLRDEISRMKLPEFQKKISDYRLNRSPFFFKLVKRKVVEDSCQSFLLSLDHLNQILSSHEAKGPKGGIRLSYDALDGTYLRAADIISLIRSGYIGTHRAETQALAAIISEVSKGNKALVLAWQRKIQQEGGERAGWLE